MRDYGAVSPKFWTGGTGKALRGDAQAQLVALYLMTSPHANMIGVYYCPVDYIAKETGLSIEGASEALRRLSKEDFCTYDAEAEWVFVHNFAANQIGESLKPDDKRVKGIANEIAKVPNGLCLAAFKARYASAFHIPASPSEAPSEAPSKGQQKPLRSQEQEQEQEQKQEQKGAAKSRQTSMPVGFAISDRVAEWSEGKGYSLAYRDANFESFMSYVRRKGPKYIDWDEALMTAIRENWAKVPSPTDHRSAQLASAAWAGAK
jgi:hypothetical protein